MLLYDYRLENNEQIICVTVDGFGLLLFNINFILIVLVKGYNLSDDLPKNIAEKKAAEAL